MNKLASCATLRPWWTHKGLFASAALLTLFVATDKVWGQATTSVRGTITDSSGGAVASATVTISNAESRVERSLTSGTDGSYQFLLLPPGTYKLAVSAQGFQRYEETGLQLLVNTPATVNVQLKVGGEKETVTVTAEEPILNMVDASLGKSPAQ